MGSQFAVEGLLRYLYIAAAVVVIIIDACFCSARNYHVPELNRTKTPDYTGRGNVTLFLELAAKADLFVIWRIGSLPPDPAAAIEQTRTP